MFAGHGKARATSGMCWFVVSHVVTHLLAKFSSNTQKRFAVRAGETPSLSTGSQKMGLGEMARGTPLPLVRIRGFERTRKK